MATHFSILAWKILWSEEPARLQSMGSQESDMTERINHHHPCQKASSAEAEKTWPGAGWDPLICLPQCWRTEYQSVLHAAAVAVGHHSWSWESRKPCKRQCFIGRASPLQQKKALLVNTFRSPFLRLLKCRKASRNLDILWEKGSQDHSNFFVVILKLIFF